MIVIEVVVIAVVTCCCCVEVVPGKLLEVIRVDYVAGCTWDCCGYLVC